MSLYLLVFTCIYLYCTYIQSQIDLDFDTFKMLKSHHIKELLPKLNDRIKFESALQSAIANENKLSENVSIPDSYIEKADVQEIEEESGTSYMTITNEVATRQKEITKSVVQII